MLKNNINYIFNWGLGIGDWGLGIGDWAKEYYIEYNQIKNKSILN